MDTSLKISYLDNTRCFCWFAHVYTFQNQMISTTIHDENFAPGTTEVL